MPERRKPTGILAISCTLSVHVKARRYRGLRPFLSCTCTVFDRTPSSPTVGLVDKEAMQRTNANATARLLTVCLMFALPVYLVLMAFAVS